MKLNTSTVVVTLLIGVLLAGCDESTTKGPDERVVNTRLMNSYNDTAIQNAIVSQHTLFAYHFVQDGPELNELGERDLAILTQHFVRNGGYLNIRRHEASAELYQARVNTVRDRLQEAGIDMERVRVSEGMPGGSGMASERVLVILESKGVSSPAATSTSFTSGAK
jgi:hypothetical protein